MKKIIKISVLAFLVFNLTFLFGETISFSGYNVMIDLPEGFKLLNSNNKDRFLFSSSILPCEIQVALDPKFRYPTTNTAGENIFRQLKASHKDMHFLWCEKTAQFSTMEFYANADYFGWVLVLQLQNGWVTLTAYSKKADAKICEPLLISALDSIYTSTGSFYVPGPITSCLYKRQNPIQKVQNILGQKVKFFVDAVDVEANKSVVDREFQLLTSYLSTEYAVSAWKRYYQNIFRDAWKRLSSFSFEIKNILLEEGVLENKNLIVKKLLKTIQQFTYVRDHYGSDFVDLVTATINGIGDCDTRCLLLALVLSQLGIDSVLFVSPEYSHSVLGVQIFGSGAKMQVDGTNYLIAETTANVELGKIAADLADPAKWFSVKLYGYPKA